MEFIETNLTHGTMEVTPPSGGSYFCTISTSRLRGSTGGLMPLCCLSSWRRYSSSSSSVRLLVFVLDTMQNTNTMTANIAPAYHPKKRRLRPIKIINGKMTEQHTVLNWASTGDPFSCCGNSRSVLPSGLVGVIVVLF